MTYTAPSPFYSLLIIKQRHLIKVIERSKRVFRVLPSEVQKLSQITAQIARLDEIRQKLATDAKEVISTHA